MQYTVSLSSRMLAIAALCTFLLCVLLFLLGMELGKRFGEPAPAAPVPSIAGALPAAPTPPALPAPVSKP